MLEDTGRMRVGDESPSRAPLSTVLVSPAEPRPVVDDTAADARCGS